MVNARRYPDEIGLAVLGIVVLAGRLNLLGVRHAAVSSSAEGYRLTVEYASVTRPGLASPGRSR